MGEKGKLTEWPENLKEVIDWFLRVAEMDPESNGLGNTTKLKDAVQKLGGFTAATTHVGDLSVDGLFNYVARALQHFIGYNSGSRQLEGKGVGSLGYTSSYSNKAQWNGELYDSGSYQANKAASIFLGSMPMVYYFVTYLYWRCSNSNHDGWSTGKLNDAQSGLNNFMLQMDFPSEQLSTINGSAIVKLIEGKPNGFDGLAEVYKGDDPYENFLKKLKGKYGESKINSAMDCPMYTLYRAAKAYLKSKLQSESHGESDPNLQEIKNRILKFKGACSRSHELNNDFKKFLSEINVTQSATSKNGNPSQQSSSSGAAAAGGLLGTAAIGGTAAALATNIGGVTTTLKSLIPIFK
ncbi:variant erythrocyte surface antigen-1 family protein [Babesia caballi]|uniref:Variant erythrocyte surface antigen-1 family protein n=1 Tax=Babesia caballi TaxID=5871 RepID=A0AAV4LPC2_BABCB|nr:variant erythrocyte surface antigen-1 family protein [Babesia caballi]